MVIGDIPPPVCAFGLLGPRAPLSTSSKPIVSLLPHFLPRRDITVRYDRYKAPPRQLRRRRNGKRTPNSAIKPRGYRWKAGWFQTDRSAWPGPAASAALSAACL